MLASGSLQPPVQSASLQMKSAAPLLLLLGLIGAGLVSCDESFSAYLNGASLSAQTLSQRSPHSLSFAADWSVCLSFLSSLVSRVADCHDSSWETCPYLLLLVVLDCHSLSSPAVGASDNDNTQTTGECLPLFAPRCISSCFRSRDEAIHDSLPLVCSQAVPPRFVIAF